MEFDSEKSLAENLATLRTECEKLDKECTKILFDNLHLLQHTGDTQRDRVARQQFNAAVKSALAILKDAGET